MADTHTSSESQTSLSLKEKGPSQPIAVMASSPELPAPPMPRATNETEKEPEKANYITGLKLHIVLFGLTLVGFVIMLDQTIVSTVRGTLNLQPGARLTNNFQAIPRITNTFNSIKDIGWYGSAYMLSLYRPLSPSLFLSFNLLIF